MAGRPPPRIADLPPPAPSLPSRASLPLRVAHRPRGGAWQRRAKKRSMCTVPSRDILPLTLHLHPPQSLPHPLTVSLSALWAASSRRRTSLGSNVTDPLWINPQTDSTGPVWVVLVGRVASQSAPPRDIQTSLYMTVSKWWSWTGLLHWAYSAPPRTTWLILRTTGKMMMTMSRSAQRMRASRSRSGWRKEMAA